MKKALALILSIVMILALAACGASAPASTSTAPEAGSTAPEAAAVETADKPIVLKLNHVQSNTDPCNEAFLQLADLVKERSNGSIEIQVYANGELGSNKDNLEQIRNGAEMIAVGDTGFLADYVPDFGIMNGPFLYGSYEDLVKLSESDWYKEMTDKCSEEGIKVLAMNWYFGERHLISKKPVNSVEDMKGLKARVPSNTMWTATMTALGAAPATIQWSEVFSALDQGVVDAAEAPLSTIYTSNLQEAASYITLTGHFTGIIGLEMSQKVWDSLSENQQKVLEECVAEQGKIYSEGVIASEQEWRAKLEEAGVTFIEVDRAPFKEACATVYTEAFPEWSDGLYDTVLAAMK